MSYEEYKDKLVLTAEEVRKIMRLGRNTTYQFLAQDTCPFPVHKIGNCLRIPADSFFQWLEKKDQI